jgi:hypothetical protein
MVGTLVMFFNSGLIVSTVSPSICRKRFHSRYSSISSSSSEVSCLSVCGCSVPGLASSAGKPAISSSSGEAVTSNVVACNADSSNMIAIPQTFLSLLP